MMTPGAAAAQKCKQFRSKTFLAIIEDGKQLVTFAKKKTIFLQDEPSDSVLYIQKGKVQLTVTSQGGKEAVIGLLKEGDFLGEDCLTGEPLRRCSAIALIDCGLVRIDKKTMRQMLRHDPAFFDIFLAYLLERRTQYQDALVDHLFNSSEKRLARILLMLAHFGNHGAPQTVVPKIKQETLAEMVGTTRSRVNLFMNKFRRLGFIDYDSGREVQVRKSLVNVVLHG